MQAVLLRKTDVCLPFYGLRLETPQRRAAVHSLCYSVGSSAHSPANALELERVRATSPKRRRWRMKRAMLAKNKEHNARSKGDRRLCFERVMRRLAKQAVPSQFSDSFYHCGAAIGGLFLGGYKVVDFTFLCFFAGEPSSTPRSVKKKRQRSGSSIRCRRIFFI